MSMAGRSLLFVHSPLVGPSSLRPLEDAATSAGYEVALPDLSATVHADDPHRAYRSAATNAASALTAPPIVVGHSGDSNHLGTRTRPDRVMHAIIELIGRLGAGRGT